MYTGKMVKLSKNNNALRTDSVVGFFYKLPEEGESFYLMGESLSPEGTVRSVTTSTVKSVTTDNEGIIFSTRNSVYKLYYKAI